MRKKTKTYKDYCRDAVERDPQTYSKSFNRDGSLKKTLITSTSIYKRVSKIPSDIPTSFLKR